MRWKDLTINQVLGFYVSKETKGQTKKAPVILSDGEYVVPANVLAHLGDSNKIMLVLKKLDFRNKLHIPKYSYNSSPTMSISLCGPSLFPQLPRLSYLQGNRPLVSNSKETMQSPLLDQTQRASHLLLIS